MAEASKSSFSVDKSFPNLRCSHDLFETDVYFFGGSFTVSARRELNPITAVRYEKAEKPLAESFGSPEFLWLSLSYKSVLSLKHFLEIRLYYVAKCCFVSVSAEHWKGLHANRWTLLLYI